MSKKTLLIIAVIVVVLWWIARDAGEKVIAAPFEELRLRDIKITPA